MYSELTAEGEDGSPPLLEMVRLLLAAQGKKTPGASRALVRWIARQSPETRAAMEDLEKRAWYRAAAPVFGVGYRDLLVRCGQLDQLLDPETTWQGLSATDPPIKDETEAEHLWQLALSRRPGARGEEGERLRDLLSLLPAQPLLAGKRRSDAATLHAFALTQCGSVEAALARLRELLDSAPVNGEGEL
jgi:hypothetical protein